MLTPPLSRLPVELLDSIVEHVAKLPLAFKDEILYNLSLADRAFTQSCQKHIFWNFKVIKRSTGKELKFERAKKILDDKPSIANQVRTVRLAVSRDEWIRLFNDPTFISILQLLAKSPVPPHELHLGYIFASFIIEDPILVVRQLGQSFFSQTLTNLYLTSCENIPLPIFLICPKLRKVFLNHVGAEMSYGEYPDSQCSGRKPPSLEVLDYRDSHSLLQQMITPPSRFKTPVVLWSNLRILTTDPHEKEGMACLQPILDAAYNTLEELYLTNFHMCKAYQLPLAGLVNLSNASRLRVFSLNAMVECNGPRFADIHDINIVLGTIPESNRLTNLAFDFDIVGLRPFHRGSPDQDWDGMYKEVIRISDGKPLELELQMGVSARNLKFKHSDRDELYAYIMDKAGSLSDYPKICTHFWNPSFWDRGVGPFPSGQVRSRCRQ